MGSRVVTLANRQGIECILHGRESGYGGDSAIFRANLGAATNWMPALAGVDAVVHCAARVHQMQDSENTLHRYQKTNVDGTLQLARQAALAGVKRFVFLSSVKVNGESTLPGRPFQPPVSRIPQDPYGRSKYEAEQGLLQLAQETGLEVVIIRPPLVYGPGVKANFHTMMRWVSQGIPLPLSSVHNQRSLVFIDNLVDLILLCLRHPVAVKNVWLVSDDHDVSTADLLADMAVALGVSCRSWPLPPVILQTVARLSGKSAVAERLLGSLQVDISATRRLLGWRPVVPYDQALAMTAQAFLAEKAGIDTASDKEGK